MSYNFVFNESLGVVNGENEFGQCSAYFPLLHRNITEQEFRNILSKCVGEAARIDWVETSPPKKDYVSAFAHFNWGNKNLVNSGSVTLGKYKYYLNSDYDLYSITMLPARNPVPPTQLNIHQVSNNLKIMEDIVAAQNERIVKLEAMVQNLSEQIKFPPPPILRRSENVENIAVIPFPNIDYSEEEGEIVEEDSIQDLMSMSDSTHSSMPPLLRCSPDSWDEPNHWEPIVTDDYEIDSMV
jgi:hypothetical protein